MIVVSSFGMACGFYSETVSILGIMFGNMLTLISDFISS